MLNSDINLSQLDTFPKFSSNPDPWQLNADPAQDVIANDIPVTNTGETKTNMIETGITRCSDFTSKPMNLEDHESVRMSLPLLIT